MAERNKWIHLFVVGTWVGNLERSLANLEASVPLYHSGKGLSEAQCARVDEAIGQLPVQLLDPRQWTAGKKPNATVQ